MKLRDLLFVLPLCSAVMVGCGGSGESTVVQPTTEVSPSEAEVQSEEYAKGMSEMTN